jgi:hypothetical protein
MAFPYELIDLTHTLHEGIPTWPGHCGFNHNLHIDYSDCDGARSIPCDEGEHACWDCHPFGKKLLKNKNRMKKFYDKPL